MKFLFVILSVVALTTPAAVSAQEITLETALEEALGANEDFAILAERVVQARTATREARAALLPQLSAGASTSYTGQEVVVSDRVVQREIDWGITGSATLTLFNGAAYPLVAQAKRSLEATEFEAQWQGRALTFEVESAYYRLAAAQRALTIATATVELRQAYADQATALEASGIALPLDVARATVQLLEAQQAVLEAETNVGVSANALAVMLGREPTGQLRAAPTAPSDGPPDGGELNRERADLLANAQRVDAARALRSSRWWALAPTLGVGSNLRYGPPSFSSPRGLGWSVTLSLTWLLYDGGARYARIEAAESMLRETELRQQQLERYAVAGVQDALRQWQTAHRAIEVAQQQSEVARQAYDMTVARFQSGLATSIEVTESSDQLFRAESALSAAQLADDVAAARYRHLNEAL